METSYAVADGLHLVGIQLGAKKATKPVEVPTNHVVVIDCSGSMYYDLPKIREQLKKKLPKMIGDKDTVSIIWFSGRNQFGTLLEGEPVATLADLQDVNKAVDRWLKPVGLTGFKEPLQEATKLVQRLGKKTPGNVFSLFFMSDGCDNQWSRSEILKAMEEAAGGFAATTIVEYGYYADRPMLTAMAEKAGGSLIFAQDFDRYAPTFEAAMGKRPMGGKKVEVPIKGDAVGGFAFATDGKDLLTFTVEDGKVLVPEGTPAVWYVSPTSVGKAMGAFEIEIKGVQPYNCNEIKKGTHPALNAGYAAISLYSVRMLPDVVLPFLKATGDVAFIEKFGGLFGKQKYSEFMDAAKEAAFDPDKRYTKGYDPSKVPADDAFTVLDLLQLLAADDGNRVLMEHPDFKYSRIGRGRIDVSVQLTPEEEAEVAKLTAEMSGTKDPKKLTELAGKIASITEGKKEALKFVADPAPDGYSVSNLTYNESRPNISILVRKPGTVDLSGRLDDGEHPKVPRKFPTFVFRNYAIVKDGLVNVEKLPVRVTPETYAKLARAGVVDKADAKGPVDVVLDLSALPVINRKMVQRASAKTLFEKEYALTKARAAQKVYNSVKKEKFPRKSEGYAVIYGEDAATWLKEQGLTDYSGYQPPKTKTEEARDFYMGKELKVSLKGLSSLPSLKKAQEGIAKGKITASIGLMQPAIEAVEAFLASDVYTKAANPDQLFEAWLDGQFKDAQKTVRRLLAELARIKFSVVVGQVWFTEFASLDENSLEVTGPDGERISGKVEMKEIEIAI